jgi:hypothetical protein
MAHLTRWGPVAALLLTASSAAAQVIDSRGVPYRQWDFAATVGMLTSLEAGDFLTERDDWSATWTVEGDLGRFWTTHVKTELAAVYVPPRRDFGSEPVPTSADTVGYAVYEARTRRGEVGVSVSYQFFENVFAHPYVSAGARVEWTDIEKTRMGTALVSGRSPTTVAIAPLNKRQGDVQTYPFAAAGFKSYFDERSFIRSEMSTAYNGRGINQLTLRVGFGVDF